MSKSERKRRSWTLHRLVRVARTWSGCASLGFLCACGTPAPKSITTEDGRSALELPYCLEATDCFVTADQTCPRGYDVVRWQSSRPHIIICQ
jgi:hypothetical protein